MSVEMTSQFRRSSWLCEGGSLILMLFLLVPFFLIPAFVLITGYTMNMQPMEAEARFDILIPPAMDSVFVRKKIIKERAPASPNMSYEGIHYCSERHHLNGVLA